MADTLPEEVRWLATFRDAGWPGPDEAFWARYAVLTDAPELARQMIDEATIAGLMQWPDDAVQADTPLMLMRLRGKVQMRLQLNRPRHPASEVARSTRLRACVSASRGPSSGERLSAQARWALLARLMAAVTRLMPMAMDEKPARMKKRCISSLSSVRT